MGDLSYADYCWAEGGTGFRQRDLRPTQAYDSRYLDRYRDMDENVCALSQRRLAVLEAFCPRWFKRLLDFGCGTNRFAEAAFRNGWWARGYDIVPAPEGSFPLRVKLDEAESISWDVVTFFDSLEHLPDPAGTVACLLPRMVMVSVPWCHRPGDPKWFMAWKHRRPGEHLWHWNKRSLDAFFLRLGYAPLMRSTFEDDFRPRYDPSLPNILTAIYRRRLPAA